MHCFYSPNFFILDEPTNHLDMETIEALAKAIQKFEVRFGGLVDTTQWSYFVKFAGPAQTTQWSYFVRFAGPAHTAQ